MINSKKKKKTLKLYDADELRWIRESEILEAESAKQAAPETVKPLYDMLGLWSRAGLLIAPETDSTYAAQTEALIHDWAKNKGLELSLFMPGKSPITPAEAPKEAADIIDRGLSLVTTLNTIGIIAEAASMGFIESVIWAMTNIINSSGVPSIIQDLYRTPVEIGVKIPLQRQMLRNYQPNIPDPRTLTSLRARGMLNAEAFNFWMSEHGYPDWAAEMMAYSETRMPNFSDMLEMVRRGIISPDTFQTWTRRSGLHPDTVEPLSQLRWQLPGYQDIISVYMREGYLPEKWVEIPQEFIDYMQQLGYSPEWAKRLWGKHWVLPSVDLLYEMFWKKIISYDDMVQMLRYHDFEPVWRDRLIRNAYRMIPRVDLRRAYRYGITDITSLTERYEWLGYSPEDSAKMSSIAVRESLDRYYTRLETVARAAYRKGLLSREGFEQILRQINTPEAAISLALEAEDLAKSADVREPAEEPPTLTVSQILSLYRERLMSRDLAIARLRAKGYSEDDLSFLLSLSEPKPEPVEVNRELISAASQLYREGFMPKEEFAGYLRKAGLSPSEIDMKIASEDLRYRYDYLKDLVALAKEAYKKDVYTQEEMEGYLLYYGMQYERVKALSALEQLRKLPKPKGAG
jgi:hypothetical protein